MPPPPAVVDGQRDWPILLAQRLRASKWVNAQVDLVGRVECRTPDPLHVLNVGGRYELTDRHVSAARAELAFADRQAVIAYLERDDELEMRTDEDGRQFYVARPPAMHDHEAGAFQRLWMALALAGHVELRPPRPRPTPDGSTTGNGVTVVSDEG